MVHGDNLTTPGYDEQLDWFKGQMEKRSERKHRGRIGLAEDDYKEMRKLNRINIWTEKEIQYEGHQRHVEIECESFG